MTREEFNSTWMPLAGSLFRVAYYLLEDEALAKDTVQDVFVRLWTSRDKLEHVLNPSSYASMMVRNACIDIIRKASKTRTVQLDEAVSTTTDEFEIDPRERLKAAGAAIRKLPDIQRRIIELRVYKKMEFEQIAEELNLTQVNVRVQLSRARKTLRKLTEMEYEKN